MPATISIGGNLDAISFDNGIFDSTPVVLGQSSGDVNKMAVTDRIDDVSSKGFSARLFQQEKSVGDIAVDNFSWIAMEQGGTAGNGAVAGSTGKSVNQNAAAVNFDGVFSSDEFAMVTDLQSIQGGDPSTLQTVSLDQDSMVLRVLEEQSKDDEVQHVNEVAGFVGFELGDIQGTDLAFV